jgi:hypothetical protein
VHLKSRDARIEINNSIARRAKTAALNPELEYPCFPANDGASDSLACTIENLLDARDSMLCRCAQAKVTHRFHQRKPSSASIHVHRSKAWRFLRKGVGIVLV